MKRAITIALAVLSISAYAGTFETEDLFSITLPDGWVRMPDDVLISYAETMAENSVDEEAPFYDYGFQLNSSDGWLTYPCVMVQVNYTGRYATGDLDRYAEDAGGENVQLNDAKDLFMDVREQNGVKILIARQLTEYGFIELSGFAPEETFAQYENIFRDAFSTLKLDEKIQYKPQITDNAPVVGSINIGKVVLVGIQAALVGGVLWLVYVLLKGVLKRSLKSA